MKNIFFALSIVLFFTSQLFAQESFDTSAPDWDYKALTEMRWMMDIIGTYQNSIPEIYIRKTRTDELNFSVELPDERIGGYQILKPEEGHEYYAILEDGNERDIFFRRSDGIATLGNNSRAWGVFAIREKENEPGVYYRDVLRWPLEINEYPEDSFYHYKSGVPESYVYTGKGVFYAPFNTSENTMEGVYMYNHKSRRGEEKFRMEKLPNHDWRLSMALPSTQALAYGHIFDCFIRQISPGVWESDGAFGIQYQLHFEPENRRIRLIWEEESWKGFPLMNVYLYPYDDIFTPDGRLKRHQ